MDRPVLNMDYLLTISPTRSLDKAELFAEGVVMSGHDPACVEFRKRWHERTDRSLITYAYPEGFFWDVVSLKISSIQRGQCPPMLRIKYRSGDGWVVGKERVSALGRTEETTVRRDFLAGDRLRIYGWQVKENHSWLLRHEVLHAQESAKAGE